MQQSVSINVCRIYIVMSPFAVLVITFVLHVHQLNNHQSDSRKVREQSYYVGTARSPDGPWRHRCESAAGSAWLPSTVFSYHTDDWRQFAANHCTGCCGRSTCKQSPWQLATVRRCCQPWRNMNSRGLVSNSTEIAVMIGTLLVFAQWCHGRCFVSRYL